MSHPIYTITKEQCLKYDYAREPGMIWVTTTDLRYPELRLTVSEVRYLQDGGSLNW